MSWRVEVVTHGPRWRGDQLRFATETEAYAKADHMMLHWPSARAIRVVESLEAANVSWQDGQLAAPLGALTPRTGKAAAVVIAAGRSVRDVCLPLLQHCSVPIIAVNGAVRFAPFADYVFTLDTSELEDRLRLEGYAGRRIAAVPDEYFARRSRRTGRFRRAPRRAANIRYLPRVQFTSIDPPDRIMTGCSGFGALQFAYKFLEAREVFLFGCDHDDQGRYFYGDASDARHSHNWSFALKYWNSLTLPENVRVWNGSRSSRIESFPKLDWRALYQILGLPTVPVVTVLKCSSEYDERHVEWVQRQVGFPIVCLTDSRKHMKNVVSIPLTHGWPGWWSKMEMFRDDLCLGSFLYVDLDTVILGGIPDVFSAHSETQVISDLYGQPWIQSCLMFVHNSSRPAIWEAFSSRPESTMREIGLGGDQKFIDRFLHDAKRLDDTFPGGIISYKADVLGNRFRDPRRGTLETARFVCFHGKPRPWEVGADWIPPL